MACSAHKCGAGGALAGNLNICDATLIELGEHRTMHASNNMWKEEDISFFFALFFRVRSFFLVESN